MGIAFMCACTNNRCTITGSVSGLEGKGWIFLKDMWNDFNVIDSVRYDSGKFLFELNKIEFELEELNFPISFCLYYHFFVFVCKRGLYRKKR